MIVVWLCGPKVMALSSIYIGAGNSLLRFLITKKQNLLLK